jgi:flagellar hook assembly protein FlgD
VIDRRAEESIEISFNAPRASHVTVRIYDMKGREVATLFDGLCLGPQIATWDGRDDHGRQVPSGVYLCHVLARDRGKGDGSNAAVPIVVGTKLD